MIVFLREPSDSLRRKIHWLSCIALATAINLALIALASLAPQGARIVAQTQREIQAVAIEVRTKAPPPPDLHMWQGEELQLRLPPRYRVRRSSQDARLGDAQSINLPPRLDLDLQPCPEDVRDRKAATQCLRAPQWTRGDRDASDLLGPETKGLTLNEAAAIRGWIKAKPDPPTRQSAMSDATDIGAAEMRGQVFKDPPFPPHAGNPQAAGP